MWIRVQNKVKKSKCMLSSLSFLGNRLFHCCFTLFYLFIPHFLRSPDSRTSATGFWQNYFVKGIFFYNNKKIKTYPKRHFLTLKKKSTLKRVFLRIKILLVQSQWEDWEYNLICQAYLSLQLSEKRLQQGRCRALLRCQVIGCEETASSCAGEDYIRYQEEFLHVECGQHWNRVPSEVLESPPLEPLKRCVALRDMI